MFSNLFGDVPFVPEPGEQVVGQYRTVGYVQRNRPGGLAGALIVTSQRVVFFRRENVIKKIISSIRGKQESPGYKLDHSVYLGQIYRVKKGSSSGHKFISINGQYFYLENADPRPIEKILKTAMKSGSLVKPGMQAPVNAPPGNQGYPQQSQTQSGPVPLPGTKVCTYCGVENRADGQFCKSCGARLQA
ncbi:MAG: zinc ribbon domain-containing protein [Candidatus Lokiarchaeota archaeon]|nr:zinc ribbon domain-containing protein [Candidatus Lokiarchaeota archaeon]